MKFFVYIFLCFATVMTSAQSRTECWSNSVGVVTCDTQQGYQAPNQSLNHLDLGAYWRGAEQANQANQQQMILDQQIRMQQQMLDQQNQLRIQQDIINQHRSNSNRKNSSKIEVTRTHKIEKPNSDHIVERIATQKPFQPGKLVAVLHEESNIYCKYKPVDMLSFDVNGVGLRLVRVTQQEECGKRILLSADGSARTR